MYCIGAWIFIIHTLYDTISLRMATSVAETCTCRTPDLFIICHKTLKLLYVFVGYISIRISSMHGHGLFKISNFLGIWMGLAINSDICHQLIQV